MTPTPSDDDAPPDLALIDEFLQGVEAGRTTFTLDVIEEVAHVLESTPRLMREIRRRRMWAEAARFFDAALADGLSTRKAADATARRLAALGFKAPFSNTIRQRLIRLRIEARAGIADRRCAHTNSHPDTGGREENFG